MPRAPRIEYPGAMYHVMCRGDRREAIYHDDGDRELFLRTVTEACERSGLFICSYVLMNNHYHLLMETPSGNLVEGMRWLQSTYTARFNARHRQRGHVFQGRYKAIPIDPEDGMYAQAVSEYIHLNPARAGIVNHSSPVLKSYRWSSFPIICRGGKAMPGWLKAEEVLNWQGGSIERAKDRREYEMRLEQRARDCRHEGWETGEEAKWLKAVRRGWYLGGETFRERLEDLAGAVVAGGRRESYSGEALRGHDEKEAARLLGKGLKALGMSLAEARRLRRNDPRKQGLAWLIKSKTAISDRWMQDKLEMGHRSNISRTISQYRDEATREVRQYKRKLHICTD